ncbi:MAG: 6-phosphogluconolactonase [Betaproteobacteria bacterium]|nr:6-phosphogluconolactonase [Betaproteobacteria bacterium]
MAESGLYVYVSQQDARQISVFRMSSSGELNKVQDVSVTGKAMPMAVSPDRRFLFVALRTEPYSIASFAIDGANGMLTHLGNAPAPNSAPYISTDRTGRFLLGAYNPESEGEGRRTGWISVSAIGPHGHVQAPHQVIRTPPKTHSILPDPSNRFAFVASCDGDAMVRYAFDAATGLFDPDPLPLVHVQPKAGPRHFVFHPNYRFMYLLNEYDGSLYSYGYDARTAELTELQVSSTVPPEFDKARIVRAADVHLTPDGKWLYASGRHPLTLAIFRVDAVTGRVTPAGHVPVAKEPRGFNIDPFGRYLVVAGTQTNSLSAYRIDPESGGLTKLADYPTGAGPNWIEFVRLP